MRAGSNSGWACVSRGQEHLQGRVRSRASDSPGRSLFQRLVSHGRGWRLQGPQGGCPESGRCAPTCPGKPLALPGAGSWDGGGSTGAAATPEGWHLCAGNPSWCPGRQGVGSSSPIHSLSSSHHLANRLIGEQVFFCWAYGKQGSRDDPQGGARLPA